MDVADDGYVHFLFQERDDLAGVLMGEGDPDQFAAGFFKLPCLLRVSRKFSGSVLSMDWTMIGPAPPMGTLPTVIFLVFFLFIVLFLMNE